jgi:FKBP-type peptidyl-prolyl cis-trans isomerase 2
MEIKKNSIVTMHYVLSDNNDKLLETTKNGMPIQFMMGINFLLPSLEKELCGLKPGERKKIIIPAEHGYGLKRNDLILKMLRCQLPDGNLKIGSKLWRGSAEGERKSFKVTGFLDDWIFLDGNHPWAGMDLHYKVEIISVRHIRKPLA